MRIIAAELTADYILHSVCLMLDRIKNYRMWILSNESINLVNLSYRTCVADIINR